MMMMMILSTLTLLLLLLLLLLRHGFLVSNSSSFSSSPPPLNKKKERVLSLLEGWTGCVNGEIRPAIAAIPTVWISSLDTQKALWIAVALQLHCRSSTRIRIRRLWKCTQRHPTNRPGRIQTLQQASELAVRGQERAETSADVEHSSVLVRRRNVDSGGLGLLSSSVWSGRHRRRRHRRRRGRRRRAFGVGGALGVLAAAATHRNVAESAALGPVAAAVLAEVAGLGEIVVVVVAEFSVGGFTARAFEVFLLWKMGFHRLKRWWVLHCHRIQTTHKKIFSPSAIFSIGFVFEQRFGKKIRLVFRDLNWVFQKLLDFTRFEVTKMQAKGQKVKDISRPKNGFFIEKKKNQENHQKHSPLPKNKINQKGHFHPTKWISISIITQIFSQTFHFNSHETNSNSQLGFI